MEYAVRSLYLIVMQRFIAFFILPVLFVPAMLRAQATHAFHAEVLGMGGLYSFSYERTFGAKQWMLQPGLSFFVADSKPLIIIPVMFKKAFGKGVHRFETGIGQGFTFRPDNGLKFFMRGLLLAGWRMQRNGSPWIFRAFYMPYISYLINVQYQHWGGIGIGYQIGGKS